MVRFNKDKTIDVTFKGLTKAEYSILQYWLAQAIINEDYNFVRKERMGIVKNEMALSETEIPLWENLKKQV